MLTSFRGKLAASIALASMGLAAPAMAQSEEEEESGPITVSANVALTTDYRFRGVSLSAGDRLEVHDGSAWRSLPVVGVASSPEYIWPARSRQELITSAGNFGVVFVPEAVAAEIAGNGPNEVAPGDPDGFGSMQLTLNQGQGEICWELEVADIQSPARAHIHSGPAGVNGPVVVFFFDLVIPNPIPVAFEGCVDGLDEDLIKDIRQSPENYYINVHNAEYPAGAIRGQLSK